MAELVPGQPPKVWDGSFLAIWPDGSDSDFDLKGHKLRVGESVPGHEDAVLDRFETKTSDSGDGRLMVVGYFREADQLSCT